jgi:hypothetical protein
VVIYLNLGAKVDELYELRVKKDELNAQLTEINKQIDALEYQILQDMETAGVDSVKSNLATATMKVKLYPQVKDMEALVAWANENGKPEILQRRVSEGVFKDFYEETGAYPDGVDAFQKTTLNFRKR